MSDTTASPPVELAARGLFNLAASTRFLEGFAPANRPDAAAESVPPSGSATGRSRSS